MRLFFALKPSQLTRGVIGPSEHGLVVIVPADGGGGGGLHGSRVLLGVRTGAGGRGREHALQGEGTGGREGAWTLVVRHHGGLGSGHRGSSARCSVQRAAAVVPGERHTPFIMYSTYVYV